MGTPVLFPLSQMFAVTNYAGTFQIKSARPLITDNTRVYVGSFVNVTPTPGGDPVVTLTPNDYLVTFSDASTPWRISVPNATNVLNALNLTSGPLPTFNYTPPTAAGAGIHITTAGSTNVVSLNLQPAAGITLVTNTDGSISISSAAGSSTNLLPWQIQVISMALTNAAAFDAAGSAAAAVTALGNAAAGNTNVMKVAAATNADVAASVSGNVNAAQLTGTMPQVVLPPNVVTNIPTFASLGARGGTNDDTVYFQQAANLGGCWNMGTNTTWSFGPTTNAIPACFFGVNWHVLFPTNYSGACFTTATNSAFVSFHGMVLDGQSYSNYPGRIYQNRTGVHWYYYSPGSVFGADNIIFGFDTGFDAYGTNYTSSMAYSAPHSVFNGFEIYSNGTALQLLNSNANSVVEYGFPSGIKIWGNIVGVKLNSANNELSGFQLTDNYIAADIEGGGPNGTHSDFINCNFNHCIGPYDVVVSNVNDILTFRSCNFYAGGIYLTASSEVVIKDNYFANGSGVYAGAQAIGAGTNYVLNNIFNGPYDNSSTRFYDYFTGSPYMSASNKLYHAGNVSYDTGDSDDAHALGNFPGKTPQGWTGAFSGNGSGLTNVGSAGLALSITNTPDTNVATAWFKIKDANGNVGWVLGITNQP